MNHDDRTNDRIADALRNRPTDEPTFDRPLRLPSRGDETAEPLTGLVPSLGLRRLDGSRPDIRSRTPLGALAVLILLVVVVALTLLLWRPEGTPPGAASPTAERMETFTPTDRVTCGWTETWKRGTLPAGFCGASEAHSVLPRGYEHVEWSLDPAFPLTADTRSIHVLVGNGCRSLELTAPVAQHVDWDDKRIMVSLAARIRPTNPSDGLVICPEDIASLRPHRYVVELSEPLGHRAVYDADPDPMKLLATAEGVAVLPPMLTSSPGT